MTEVGSLEARRRRRRFAWWAVLLVLVVSGGAWAVVARPWEATPTIVDVEMEKPGPASRILAINGRVQPTEQVEISATVEGRVLSVAASEGEEVTAGTPLLVIDDSQQRAAVTQARTQLDGAEAQRDKARLDLERAEALRDTVSQRSVDEARLALDTAEKEVARLTSLLDQAEDLLAEYTVKAPFDGTILSRGVNAGQVVSSSTALFLLADLDTLHGEASVDELYASEVRRGLTVRARPTGHADVLEGEVIYVSPRVDASTGGRLVQVSLPGAGELNLPVGLTVMLNIIVDERDDAITIPRSALAAGERPAVYVIEDGKAMLRVVRYIDWPSDRLVVTEGLAGGEVLIVDSKQVEAEGAPVAAKE